VWLLLRTDVSEDLSASITRVTRVGELGTTLAVTSNRRTLQRSIFSVLTRATRRNIPEDGILHRIHNVSEARSVSAHRSWEDKTYPAGSPMKKYSDPLSETSCFIVFRIPDNGQSPKSEQYLVPYTIGRTI
jgi:hypothetical protein